MPQPRTPRRWKTLADMIEHGDMIAVYCVDGSCSRNNSETPDLDPAGLIERFGPDMDVMELRRRLRCTVCGRLGAEIRLSNTPKMGAGYSPGAKPRE